MLKKVNVQSGCQVSLVDFLARVIMGSSEPTLHKQSCLRCGLRGKTEQLALLREEEERLGEE